MIKFVSPDDEHDMIEFVSPDDEHEMIKYVSPDDEHDMLPFVSPDDEHYMLETCRELQINKHIEKNLCFKLDNYQESLHDARSTKHLIKHTLCRFYKSRQASSEFSHNVSSFVPSVAFIMQHFLNDLTMPTTSSTSTHTSPFRVLSVRKFLRRNSGHRSNNKH